MKSGIELRGSPRRLTAIEADIVFSDGNRRLPCIIRNLSETGAKLEVISVKPLPNSFGLVAPGIRPQNCRVVWRALREVGVEFQRR